MTSEIEMRKHRCAFTGHRPEKLEISETRAKHLLEDAIKKSVSDGYNVFITGMARGVDLWAAELVLKEREQNKEIKLICAVPFDGFEPSWDRQWQSAYHFILEQADYTHIISKAYHPAVFSRRNRFMVDHTARLIGIYNDTSGGTRNTLQYASEQGIEILILRWTQQKAPPIIWWLSS